MKLFAGTRWCLPWCPSLPPHKVGHLGSEFEKKLALEKKRMLVTHLHKRQSPCQIVTPGMVTYTGEALVFFIREDQSSLAVRCKMLILGAGDGSPIPTGPGATRPVTGAAVTGAQGGSVGWCEHLSPCRGWETGPSSMSLLHFFLMVSA